MSLKSFEEEEKEITRLPRERDFSLLSSSLEFSIFPFFSCVVFLSVTSLGRDWPVACERPCVTTIGRPSGVTAPIDIGSPTERQLFSVTERFRGNRNI